MEDESVVGSFQSDPTPSRGALRRGLSSLSRRRWRSLESLFQELEQDELGSGESRRLTRSVYRQTPVINDNVLGGIRTRARGPVPEHPHVMRKPLEYQPQQ